ncbi:hypothetical protein LguiA_003794 [Lonicera macranthoides]
MRLMPLMAHTDDKGQKLNLTEEQLKMIFREADTNKDGRLDKKELKGAFERLGAIVSGWRAGRALYHADQDKDGFISEQELDDLVKYAVNWGYHV